MSDSEPPFSVAIVVNEPMCDCEPVQLEWGFYNSGASHYYSGDIGLFVTCQTCGEEVRDAAPSAFIRIDKKATAPKAKNESPKLTLVKGGKQ